MNIISSNPLQPAERVVQAAITPPQTTLDELEKSVGALLYALGEKEAAALRSYTEQSQIVENAHSIILSSRHTLPEAVIESARAYSEHPFTTLVHTAYQGTLTVFQYTFSCLTSAIIRYIPHLQEKQKLQASQELRSILKNLKHLQLITPKTEVHINQAFNENRPEVISRDAFGLIGDLVRDPIDNKRIIALLKEHHILEAFRYLHTLAHLHDLQSRADIWKDLSLPKESLKLKKQLTDLKENGHIDPLNHTLSSLVSRRDTKLWLERELSHPSFQHIHQLETKKATLFLALKENTPIAFAKSLDELLGEADLQKRSPLETYYLKEVRRFLKQGDSSTFAKISEQFKQEQYLSSWKEKIENFLKCIKNTKIDDHQESISRFSALVNSCMSCYGLFGTLLDQEPKSAISRTHYAHTFGKVVEVWRKINEELTSKLPTDERTIDKVHSTCSCLYTRHIHKKVANAKWKTISEKAISLASIEKVPQDTTRPESKNVLFMTCSYGNGHMSTTDALISYTQNTGKTEHPYRYHVRALNVPLEILLPLDPIFNLFGSLWNKLNTDYIYNLFMSQDRCDLIALMRKLGGGAPSEESKNQSKELIREAILKERPDLVVITYGFNAAPIIEVCKELGIPVAGVNTDTDISGYEHIDLPKHFKLTTYSKKSAKIMKTFSLGSEFAEKNLIETGPPLRAEFLRSYTQEDLQEIRQQLHIQDDEHVVFFSSGGLGVWSKIPELIASWKQPNKKIRFVVVCGKNETFKTHLESNVLPNIANKEMMKIDVLGLTSAAKMSDLMHIAHVVIGKPGGLTTAEVIHSGARFIGDQTGFRLDWEKLNNDVAIDAGIASKIEKLEDLLPTLSQELEKERGKTDLFPQDEPYNQKYLKLFADLIQDSEKDPEVQQAKKAWDATLRNSLRLSQASTVIV